MVRAIRSFEDRRRAESFGSAAEAYDAFRPGYPSAVIADLVTEPGLRVLDVGAGTGIASAQLADAGANVVAIEPDERMAELASAKGIAVEVDTFEQWQGERTFDRVVFAQSFHWVEPRTALKKVAGLLSEGGHLALLWNRIRPIDPKPETLEKIHADVRGEKRPITADIGRAEDRALQVITDSGDTIDRRDYHEDLHYAADAYLDMVFTYSHQLVLDSATQSILRARLNDAIGPSGVTAANDTVALFCVPRGEREGAESSAE